MKKRFLLFCLSVTVLGYSQDVTPDTTIDNSIIEKKHELKVGAFKLLAGPVFEGTYEYIHSKNFTYGSSILVNLSESSNYPENFSITPFARIYFQETKEYGAKGFFVEVFSKYFAGDNITRVYTDSSGSYSTNEKYNAAALGLAVGKKWINSSGFIFETLIGFGRTLGGGKNNPELVFRGDLSLGYRF